MSGAKRIVVLAIVLTKTVELAVGSSSSLQVANACEPPIYWTTGLREATYRTLSKKLHDTDHAQLRSQLYNSPIVDVHVSEERQFGDIVRLAKGQLYRTARRHYRFVQDVSTFCDRPQCRRRRPATGAHDVLVGLWTVERVRHLDLLYGYYYEFQYNIVLEQDLQSPLLNRAGHLDYSAPGHLYIVRLCKPPTKANPKWTTLDADLFRGYTRHNSTNVALQLHRQPMPPSLWPRAYESNISGNKDSYGHGHSIWLHRNGRRESFATERPYHHTTGATASGGSGGFHSIWLHRNIHPKSRSHQTSIPAPPTRHYLEPNIVLRVSQDGFKHVIHHIPQFEEATTDDTFLFGANRNHSTKHSQTTTPPWSTSRDPIFDVLDDLNPTNKTPPSTATTTPLDDIFTTPGHNPHTVLSLTTDKSSASTEPMIGVIYMTTAVNNGNQKTTPSPATMLDSNFIPYHTSTTVKMPTPTKEPTPNETTTKSMSLNIHSPLQHNHVDSDNDDYNIFETNVLEETRPTLLIPNTTVITSTGSFLVPDLEATSERSRQPTGESTTQDRSSFLLLDDYADLTTQATTLFSITSNSPPASTSFSSQQFLVPDELSSYPTRKTSLVPRDEFLGMDGEVDFTTPLHFDLPIDEPKTTTPTPHPFLSPNQQDESRKTTTLSSDDFLAIERALEYTTQPMLPQTGTTQSTIPGPFLPTDHTESTQAVIFKLDDFLGSDVEPVISTILAITDTIPLQQTTPADFLQLDQFDIGSTPSSNTYTDQPIAITKLSIAESSVSYVNQTQVRSTTNDTSPHETKPTNQQPSTEISRQPKTFRTDLTTATRKTLFTGNGPNRTTNRKEYSYTRSMPGRSQPPRKVPKTGTSIPFYGTRFRTMTSRGKTRYTSPLTTPSVSRATATTQILVQYATLPSYITPETTISKTTEENFPSTLGRTVTAPDTDAILITTEQHIVPSRTYIPPYVSRNYIEQETPEPSPENPTMYSTMIFISSTAPNGNRESKKRVIPIISVSTPKTHKRKNYFHDSTINHACINCKLQSPVTTQQPENIVTSFRTPTVDYRTEITRGYKPRTYKPRRHYKSRPTKIHSTLVVNNKPTIPIRTTQRESIRLRKNLYLASRPKSPRLLKAKLQPETRRQQITNSAMIEEELLEVPMFTSSPTHSTIPDNVESTITTVNTAAYVPDATIFSVKYNTLPDDTEILTSQSYSTSISYNVGQTKYNHHNNS